MKVLHVTADYKWTGPAEPMLNAVTGLRARGHEVDVAFPPSPEGVSGALDERAAERGVRPVLAFARHHGYVPWRDRGDVDALTRCLADGGYDLVHAHHTRDLFLARAAVRRVPAVCGVLSWHHGEAIPQTFWNRWLYGPRRNGGLTVLSEALAEAVVRDLEWPPDRVRVVPGSVDVERFAPCSPVESVRTELGLTKDDCVVGVVARLQPHRRFELLLPAFKRALERAPELRLLSIGRGTRAKEVLEAPVRQLGLEGRVLRAGYRRHDYLDVLSVIDALVFLVPGSDGSCRAVLEAMSMERPIIATRRGMLPETIAQGEAGCLVDETEASLADAFVSLARSPDRWARRGRAGRSLVVSRNDVTNLAENLEGFYESLLGSHRRR